MDWTAAQLASRCDQAKQQNDGSWRMVCPVHGGRRDVLKITENDGKILMHCKAGCSYEDLRAWFGLPESRSARVAREDRASVIQDIEDAIVSHAEAPAPDIYEWLTDPDNPPAPETLTFIWKGVRQEKDFSWANADIRPLITAMYGHEDGRAHLFEAMRQDKMSNTERQAIIERITRLATTNERLEIECWDAIEPEEVTWFWFPYIPANKITFIGGDPGLGKTWLLLVIVRAMANGAPLPGDEQPWPIPPMSPGNVIYLNHEDGLADTLVNRAHHLGVERSRVYHVYGIPDPEHEGLHIPFDFSHLDYLETLIEKLECRLLIIDPIQAYLGSKVDMHRANEVRPLMMRLKGLAERQECTIIMSQHLSKQSVGGPALYRALGSIDFAAACRSQLFVSEDPDNEDRRVLAQSKSSLKEKGESLIFSTRDDQFFWHGESAYNAQELSRMKIGSKAVRVRDARQWLQDTLHKGPIAVDTLKELAEVQGIKWRTLERAKSKLRVLSTRQATGWFWHLPDPDEAWAPYKDDTDIPF